MPPLKSKSFEWSYTEEPHATRRQTLLSSRPEVQTILPFSDTTFKWKALLGVSTQILMAWLVSDMPWWAVISLAYLIGGTLNHAMTLALHETSHNLAFGATRPALNRVFGIFVNLPLGIPAFASFQRYHKDHHTHQGEEVLDTDVPTAREGHIFTTTPSKILWVLMQPLFYAFRPLLTAPKKPGVWEATNAVAQIIFDISIFTFFGGKSLSYLIIGTLLGMGLHPMAGHFIAEHYTFIKGQEVSK
jgi:sphingolipid delta-4 desaturase